MNSLPKTFSRWLWRLLRTILILIGTLWFVVTLTPLDSWWANALSETWTGNDTGETLIVLAAERGPNGVIGYGTYLRCQYAIFAWRHGGFHKVLVSGRSQAYAMRDFLIGAGISPSSIVTETESRSTRENAIFTAHLLAGATGRTVLLTSDYHMFRASRAFRKAGLEVVTSPCPDVGKRASRWAERWPAFIDLITESGKIVFYKCHGWI